jgi:hypothetical protein
MYTEVINPWAPGPDRRIVDDTDDAAGDEMHRLPVEFVTFRIARAGIFAARHAEIRTSALRCAGLRSGIDRRIGDP